MAIYSFRLAPIGKTTQERPFMAAAHVKYICRKRALTVAMAARMPEAPSRAARWFKAEENKDRKNARVADKMIMALPRELSLTEQTALVYGFAEAVTEGKAPWFAAIHAQGKDKANPHCHLIVRDRDILTGRRVAMFSAGPKEIKQRAAKGEKPPVTLRQLRIMWEQWVNAALQYAGRPERVDHRSLKDQGIKRTPQIHEGPNIRAMHERGVRPVSKERIRRNSPNRKKGTPAQRTVRYSEIDRGMTRVEYNAALRRSGRVTLVDRLHARRTGSLPEPRNVPSRTDRSRGR